MTVAFAHAGDAVTDDDGNVICRLARDISLGEQVIPDDFRDFSEGETPFVVGQLLDERCFRAGENGGLKIRINGVWVP